MSPSEAMLQRTARRINVSWGRSGHREDAAARTRTWDYLVNSEVLYHLSYGGRQSPVAGVV